MRKDTLVTTTDIASSDRQQQTPARRLSVDAVRIAGLALACLVIAGCAVSPRPLEQDEVQSRVETDMARMFDGQTPLSGTLTLEEALARALHYNLDHRLKQMESSLALDLSRFSNVDMLPELMASAGYRYRNRLSGGTSIGILDGDVSDRPTSSSERELTNYGVVFTWNVLDFGISYYRAQQQADQFLLAEERRRKVIHNIVQDVRSAYWRALAAQRLAEESEQIMRRAELALEQSREAERQRLVSPQVALTYQRTLLDAITLLKQRQQGLEFALAELAALMNVPPGIDFVLTEVAEPTLPNPAQDILRLEEFALLQRPELREEDLRRRMTAAEARKQMLGLLPGISFDLGTQYTSNRFEYHNAWTDGGVRLGWNLLRLAGLPAQRSIRERQRSTDDARRLALSMAIITQVRLSAERYRMALEDLELAEAGYAVDRRLADYSRTAASVRIDSDLEAIRTELRAMLGAYQRANAYAEAQIALGRLQNSIGVDMVGNPVAFSELSELTDYLREQLQQADLSSLDLYSSLFGTLPAVAVHISQTVDPVQRVNAAAMVNTVLLRYPMVLTHGEVSPDLHLSLEPAPTGIWLLWQRADGTLIERILAPALQHGDAFMAQLDESALRVLERVRSSREGA